MIWGFVLQLLKSSWNVPIDNLRRKIANGMKRMSNFKPTNSQWRSKASGLDMKQCYTNAKLKGVNPLCVKRTESIWTWRIKRMRLTSSCTFQRCTWKRNTANAIVSSRNMRLSSEACNRLRLQSMNSSLKFYRSSRWSQRLKSWKKNFVLMSKSFVTKFVNYRPKTEVNIYKGSNWRTSWMLPKYSS